MSTAEAACVAPQEQTGRHVATVPWLASPRSLVAMSSALNTNRSLPEVHSCCAASGMHCIICDVRLCG